MSKKLTRKKLIIKLDNIFSKYIRLRDADKYGYCRCVTCGERLHWKKIQAGHFISRKYYATRWDEENVNAQCVACNVFKSGEQYKYSLYLGNDISLDLSNRSKEIVKFESYKLEEMLGIYKNKIESMDSFEGA